MLRRFSKCIPLAWVLVLAAWSGPGFARAGLISWDNAGGSGEWNTDTAAPNLNWTADGGSSHQAFQPNDDVVFNGTAPGTIYVGLSGTPAHVTTATSGFTGGSYRFWGGALTGGSGAMTVSGATATFGDKAIISDAGTEADVYDVSFGHASTTIGSGGQVLYRVKDNGGTNEYSFGAGTISLDNGGEFGFNGFGNFAYTLLNNFQIGPGGGEVSFGRHDSNPTPIFAGNFDLQGTLWLDAGSGGGSAVDQHQFNGTITLNGDRTIHIVSDANGSISFGGILDGADTAKLTFTGTNQNVTLQGDGTNLRVAALEADPNVRLRASDRTDDFLSRIRTNGGHVTINRQVTFERGTFEVGDFVFASGARISWNLIASSETSPDVIVNGTLQVRADMTFDSHHRWHQVDPTFLSGAVLPVPHGNGENRIRGTITMLGGSIIELTSGHASRSGGLENTGTLALGDGAALTAETITIRGLNNTDNATAVASLRTQAIADDGNVTLRYESTGSGAAKAALVAWFDRVGNTVSPVRGGSAATVFAPDPANRGVILVGPTTGDVFTAAAPTSLVTGGTVTFSRATSDSPGINSFNVAVDGGDPVLASIAIASGGTFTIEHADGLVRASAIDLGAGHIGGIGTFEADVTAINGSVSPGLSVGTLKIIGQVVFGEVFGSPGALAIDIDGSSADRLDVTGTVTVYGLDLDVAHLTAPSETEYLFMSASGQIVLAGGVNVRGGAWSVQLRQGNTQLWLVPEPATLALLAVGALGLAARRRRR